VVRGRVYESAHTERFEAMSDVAATPTVSVGSSKARPLSLVLLSTALVLVGLTYYGVMLILASAPHLQSLDRISLQQAQQIRRLSDDAAALRAENAELRERINAVQRLYGLTGFYGSDRPDGRRAFVATPFAPK
jgi:cell division protein FtsB